MGCCGCSLAASTLTAVVLGLVESIVGMTWNILVIVVIEMQRAAVEPGGNKSEPAYLSPYDNSTELSLGIELDGNETSDWETFKLTISSDKALERAHVFELSVTALVLNSFWLISTLALAVGNAEKCRDMLKPWIVTTVVITITDTAATIYFTFKAVKDTADTEVVVERLFVANIFVILATLFSRGGPIIWIANVALCIFVAQRIKQIEVIKKKRMPFDADMRVPPYTLHPPYDAYESDSYRCEKTFRPNTPPPDYGEHRGVSRKSHHRKHSDCENSTLPVSLRSGSSLQRPLSGVYNYDDQVEMQHRASLAAETHHYHHAYENRALDADSTEGWMGIPRPTLKINR